MLLYILFDVFNVVEFSDIVNVNQFIQYDYKSEFGDEFSVLVDVRVLWGGDDSVLQICELFCKFCCCDISFVDCYFVCVINGEVFLGVIIEQ